jgi:hypothetical protein
VIELIRDVGAYAGIAAFLGLAVLALLYFAQARDVRRLRESASFLIESGPEAPSGATEAEAPATEEGPGAAPAATPAQRADVEAFRRAELARQAAERRTRFEQRRRGGGRGFGRLPEAPALAVIVVGALLLVAGIGFGATRLLDDDEGGGTGTEAEREAPSQVQVAVLNGTAEPGLAAGFAKDLKQRGFSLTAVTNTENPFVSSVVMFDKGGQSSAQSIASEVQVRAVEPISSEIRDVAEGAVVAVVLGEDKVGA